MYQKLFFVCRYTFLTSWGWSLTPSLVLGLSVYYMLYINIILCRSFDFTVSAMPCCKPLKNKKSSYFAYIPYADLGTFLDQSDMLLFFIGTVIFYTVSKKKLRELFNFILRCYLAVGITITYLSYLFETWSCLGAFWFLLLSLVEYFICLSLIDYLKINPKTHCRFSKVLGFMAIICGLFLLKIFLFNLLEVRQLITNSTSSPFYVVNSSCTIRLPSHKFATSCLILGWVILFLPVELLVGELAKRNQPEDLVEFLYRFYLSIGITVFFCGYCGFTPLIDIMPVIWHFCFWLVIYHIGNYLSDTSSPESHLQLFKLITGGGVCAGLVKTYFYFAYLIAYPEAATDLSPFLWLGAFALLSFWISLMLVFNYILSKYNKYSNKKNKQ
jgi:hypothetical protein